MISVTILQTEILTIVQATKYRVIYNAFDIW